MDDDAHGVSAFENERFVKDWVATIKPKKILDVGAGSGYYGRILKNSGVRIDADEIWPASADYLRKSGWYSWVTELNILDYEYEKGTYDLVIFGDILEHLSLEDAQKVFRYAFMHANHVLVSIPNSNYPQEALYGNEHERHLIEDPATELIPLLPGIPIVMEYEMTNTYVWSITDIE